MLTSLERSDPTLFEVARFWKERMREIVPDETIADVEERIAALAAHGSVDTT